MKDLKLITHPLISDRLRILRDKNTDLASFRHALLTISRLSAFHVTSHLATESVKIETPLCEADCVKVKNRIVLVPILRAGLGMFDGLLDIIPEASIGHIGLFRDEDTLKSKSYYCNLPNKIATADVFMIDPMLATGDSSISAASELKANGAKNIAFVNLISCQEGIDNFHKSHPDICIFTTCIDPVLTENGFISPGLGDAGDRFFGTK